MLSSVCSFNSVLPEDTLELGFLKDYITWPETPSLPLTFSLNDTSHPAHSTYTILPCNGGGRWHVGDQLEVLIKINDFSGHPKKYGGDVLFARLHNPTVRAGVVGKVFDHHNGSYTAVFSLLWEGSAEVEGAWRALDGTTVRQFNNGTAMSQCLKGKVVHLYGDSTIRQWFEYLVAKIPGRCQVEIVVGGSNTVVVIGVWAHFSTFPVEVYVRRLLSIRRAVVRLLTRAPDTLVVIRTANPTRLTVQQSVTTDDFYFLQRDKILRAIFKEVNVRLLDAWEMSQAHYLPHDVHPPPPIIKNMMDVVLSHICPSGEL
ncbi:hypothetical protein XENOCAPTIV_029111 [Xenoophorus captivus]|uniref:NXPE C-terminal domain-containing protein n=1 Tax=Xenoophorus captivus TaxID=1517983 RepID=A0ABV0SED3_9TELE